VSVPVWAWLATVAGLAGVIVGDLLLVDRRDNEFQARDAVRWVSFYIGVAVAFGVMLYFWQGASYAGQFFAGYVTEYSLSIDNLFVFMVLMSSFAVPKYLQHRVLLLGVVIALILRTILIIVGAAVLARFSGAFYIFGAFLLYTGYKVWNEVAEEKHSVGDNAVVRLVKRFLPTATEYDGHHFVTKVDGKKLITPMALVVVSIGAADLLFALDSIPAVFGLTNETYIVFTVNAFALMGLRQLYFLLGGLLSRLVYLNKGLAVILVFIGVKLVLEALHATTNLTVPTVSVALSLAVIVGVLMVTAALSLVATRQPPGDEFS